MIKPAIVLAGIICAMLTLAGCGTYVPDGATVISVKNVPQEQEYDRAILRPENQLQGGGLGIRMKWYDTNTYMTTATLSPGIYKFQATRYNGGGISRNIRVTADKDFYEVDASRKDDEAGDDTENEDAMGGPELRGRVNSPAVQVSVLFIGSSISMKEADVQKDGSFSTTFPGSGTWRVEIHKTGNPPQSYVHGVMNVTGPVDLGVITLQ